MSVVWRARRDTCDPQFAADIDAELGADPGHWIVTTSDRDRAVEAAGYAAWQADHSKPKYTDPDNSAHCCVPARAVDVTLVSGSVDDWDYTDASWQRLYARIRAHPRLHSGILFPVPDGDHIQQVNWKVLAGITVAQ